MRCNLQNRGVTICSAQVLRLEIAQLEGSNAQLLEHSTEIKRQAGLVERELYQHQSINTALLAKYSHLSVLLQEQQQVKAEQAGAELCKDTFLSGPPGLSELPGLIWSQGLPESAAGSSTPAQVGSGKAASPFAIRIPSVPLMQPPMQPLLVSALSLELMAQRRVPLATSLDSMDTLSAALGVGQVCNEGLHGVEEVGRKAMLMPSHSFRATMFNHSVSSVLRTSIWAAAVTKMIST